MSDNEMKEVRQDEEELSDIVELVDEQNVVRKFYHVGTIDYKGEWYVGFQAAEEIEGVDPDELVIFKIEGDEDDEVLKPIEDEALLEEVYEEFCRQLDEEEAADEAELLDCDENCAKCSNQCPSRKDD